MHFVYLIYSKKLNKIYKGSTDNLKERLRKHNSGAVKSTKSGLLWKLIYCEVFTNKRDALREEIFLKTGKGRERIKYLLKNTFENL